MLWDHNVINWLNHHFSVSAESFSSRDNSQLQQGAHELEYLITGLINSIESEKGSWICRMWHCVHKTKCLFLCRNWFVINTETFQDHSISYWNTLSWLYDDILKFREDTVVIQNAVQKKEQNVHTA